MERQPEASGGEGGETLRGGPDCLEPDALEGLVQGWLAGGELARAEAHIDRCPECRRCVSELAKGLLAPPSGAAPDDGDAGAGEPGAGEPDAGEPDAAETSGPPPLAPGTALGRYVVDGLLGAGGMGLVYAAYDPELDRKVALKMLRTPAAGGPEARERLLREARAMARLTHPNVVAVHDVGAHEGQLFLAMEFIEGITLRSWLRRASRPAREVLRALAQAGRGLAAAHAVGVVHRDVKPATVLVDHRGRVCVTAFGLARAALGGGPAAGGGGPGEAPGARPGAEGEAPGARPGAEGAPSSATRSGALTGTPAYMAPELYRGEAASAKSDQFSFCVMLYEALYRQRPFEGPTWRELADAVVSGKLREPPPRAGAPVPVRARRALLRGLSVEPADRFPSIDALLEALTDEPGARRRRLAAALGAGLALAALPVALRHGRPDAGQLCGRAELRLAGAWGEGRKGAVREAFLATGKPFAPDAWRGVEGAIDGYARAWAAARQDACEATHVRGEQSAELLDLRMACLDDRAKDLGALADVFARADADVVIKALGAAQSLAPLAPCADARALRARVRPPSGAAAERATALRGELGRAQALADAGKYREALPLAAGAVEGAEALGYLPVLAEALHQHGRMLARSGDVKASEATLRRAITAADAAGDDATRALAYSGLLFNLGALQAKGEFVPLLNEQAQAALARAGGDPGIDGLRRNNFAASLRRQGRFDEARAEYEGALPLLERAYGAESRQLLVNLYGLGNTHLSRKDLDAARDAFQRYLERSERALGPHHPSVAEGLSGLATVLMTQLRFAEAGSHLERALTIMEGAFGPESQVLTPYLDNLGSALSEQGRYDESLACFRRSLALTERQLGPDHPLLLWPLTGLGEAWLNLGDRAQAVAHLERAVQRHGTADAASDLALAQFTLARALSESGRERPRARALALAARDAYRASKNSPLDARTLRRVEQWLERHPRG